MPACIIFIRNAPVHDPAEMAAYQSKTRQIPPTSGVRPLIVYGKMEALEGTPPDGVVLLQFENIEAARAWYNSDGYQAALPHRLKAADYTAYIMDGFQP